MSPEHPAVRLSLAVAAHPARAGMVEALQARLDRPANIVWDKHSDEWETHQRSWASYDPEATHHLVLQDDAVPCRDLAAGVERALGHAPDDAPVSLYLGGNANYRGSDPRHHAVSRAIAAADRHRSSWIITTGTWWGVAIILPTACIDDMLTWCQPRREVYDRRLTTWCRARKLSVWYPWPSLVDHADNPSLVSPGRRPGRTARRFIGAYASALDFNPTGPATPCLG